MSCIFTPRARSIIFRSCIFSRTLWQREFQNIPLIITVPLQMSYKKEINYIIKGWRNIVEDKKDADQRRPRCGNNRCCVNGHGVVGDEHATNKTAPHEKPCTTWHGHRQRVRDYLSWRQFVKRQQQSRDVFRLRFTWQKSRQARARPPSHAAGRRDSSPAKQNREAKKTGGQKEYFLEFSVPWPKTLIWKLTVISEYILQNSLLPFVEIIFFEKLQFVGQLFMSVDSQTLV